MCCVYFSSRMLSVMLCSLRCAHAGYNRAIVMCATKTAMWIQCLHGQASDIIVEYSNVKISQHAVLMGVLHGIV